MLDAELPVVGLQHGEVLAILSVGVDALFGAAEDRCRQRLNSARRGCGLLVGVIAAHLQDADLHEAGELLAVELQFFFAELVAGGLQGSGGDAAVLGHRHIANEIGRRIDRFSRAAAHQGAH